MGAEIEKVVIDKTINWLTEVVIGHNFCPFASKPVKEGLVHYQVVFEANFQSVLEALIKECLSLDNNEETETTLIIFPESFLEFDEYLEENYGYLLIYTVNKQLDTLNPSFGYTWRIRFAVVSNKQDIRDEKLEDILN